MWRRLAAAAVACLTLAAGPVVAAPSGGVQVLVIDGRGFGHGVGMAQDGALAMGQAGAGTPQILGQFYPGTKLGRTSGAVRVVVVPGTPDNDVVVAFPTGGEIRDALAGQQSVGFPVKVTASQPVHLHWDGARYSVGGAGVGGTASGSGTVLVAPVAAAAVVPAQIPGTSTSTTSPTPTLPGPTSTTTTSTTAPPPPSPGPSPSTTTTTAPPPPGSPPPPGAPPPAPTGPSSTRSLWAVPTGAGVVAVPARGRQYRGVAEATTAGATNLRLVNQVDVEQYLRGMGEVRNPAWPPASLRAQAIAARTYALRAMTRGGELCDDTRCQVYLGSQAEYAQMNKAVSDTKGQVLVYGSGLASAVYSANAGGVEASREEGFGASPSLDSAYPYLRPAPYMTRDPQPWTEKVAFADVAARLGYGGRLAAVAVGSTGPSGRVLDLVLDGSAGRQTVTGLAAAGALGLRSTLFTVRTETDATAPPPPAAGSGIQQLPDDATAVTATQPPGPGASELAVPTLPGPADIHPLGAHGVRGVWPWVLLSAALAATAGLGITRTVRARRATTA